MNNKNKFLLIAGLSLSFALPTYSFAAETETKEEDSYATRLALANEIKKYRAMRKELPIPPPAGLLVYMHFLKKASMLWGSICNILNLVACCRGLIQFRQMKW